MSFLPHPLPFLPPPPSICYQLCGGDGDVPLPLGEGLGLLIRGEAYEHLGLRVLMPSVSFHETKAVRRLMAYGGEPVATGDFPEVFRRYWKK